MADVLNTGGNAVISPEAKATAADIAARPDYYANPAEAAPDTVSLPTQPPTTNAPPAPPSVQGPSFGQNVYRHILNALAGTNDTVYKPGPDGRPVPTQVRSEPGQQWKKIIAGALAGVANVGNAGQGPGGGARALSAGVRGGIGYAEQQHETQRKEAMEDFDLEQKTKMQQAQLSNLTLQNTALQQRMAREGVEDAYTDAAHQREFTQWALDNGAEDEGVANNFEDILKLHKNDPTLMKAQAQGLIVSSPVIENGKVTGTHFFRVTPQWTNQRLSSDRPIQFLKMDAQHPGQFTIETEIIPAGSMTNGGYTTLQQSQTGAILKAADDKAKTDLAAKELDVKTKEAMSTISKNYADADEARAKAQQTRQQAANQANDLETLAQGYYSGQILSTDLPSRAAAAGVSKSQVVARALQIGQQQGKPFSESILKQEYDFANNQKVTALMDGMDRVLGQPAANGQPAIPGAIDTAINFAKQAGLSENAPINQVIQAVRRFGGEDAAKNFQTAIGETQRVVGGLIGNPLLGGGETDQRLKQAQNVWGANPTIKNLISTGNVLKQMLGDERQSYLRTNRYLRQKYGGESITVAPAAQAGAGAAATGGAAQEPPIPPGAVKGTLNNKRGYVLNGTFTPFPNQ